ncbi:cupin [Arthrobacter sp. MYb211]|uniref:cupin domain-containing protein n=1 Tax=unclassified Arthrobacter TaxID=235627 RepID=UPI000CFC0C11|nr:MULTISPECIES: cupin domain-containing protein [unclassified Arthrobacter]PRA00549.1 cupin [Arthrobacter sp. MYb224]PRA04742.1 cupin [Arthrobacter sp. MYb229]PRA08179.1 cupin [Arthrobacter sp. MYb221]PRB51344.1 cupin [Arthrobacter sp. MYb216]PRC02146.1 cupin [Arthrobacter sp. MYb211]
MLEKRDAHGFGYRLHEGSEMLMHHHFGGHTGLPVAIQTWVIPPGGFEGRHRHDQGEQLIEFYQVLEGTGRMRVGARTYELSSGDSVLAGPAELHDLTNTGSAELRVLVVWGPPGSVDLTPYGSHRRAEQLRGAAQSSPSSTD